MDRFKSEQRKKVAIAGVKKFGGLIGGVFASGLKITKQTIREASPIIRKELKSSLKETRRGFRSSLKRSSKPRKMRKPRKTRRAKKSRKSGKRRSKNSFGRFGSGF